VKNGACYHLVTLKAAFRVQLFAAAQARLDCGFRFIVLDLFL
jgi:hypothetical protein